ncbi:adenylate/guanylate cyclase domain-containing protein [Leptospira perolatii]|uniref:Adenylate/guanylate cyclase domain-containing protein n=1 Tax=Leptospira perolatii TaxID=2023191 RepID=A0A2M9ZIM5_9LEPT|nr:adenylate/guanylate cyclase domain-containing protein [Leptospira perolatii]PJZ68457.1 adenylate/guanylate cyclase domain-containing protein [Leptospira perolatii]PJZ71915.1 adenylate/guanylate cyclase domain-containing protein [Leptospira perolatii]
MYEFPLEDRISIFAARFSPDQGELNTWLEELHLHGIIEVIFWGSQGDASNWKSAEKFREFVKILKEENIAISTIDGSRFRASGSSADKLEAYFRKSAKSGSVMVFYSADFSQELLVLLNERFPAKKIEHNKSEKTLEPEPKEELEKQDILKDEISSEAHTEEAHKGAALAGGEKGGGLFKASAITIRVKLLSIVTAIVVLSMGLVIGLATTLFRNYTVSLIQEYNLSLARLTGLQVGLRIRELSSKLDQLYSQSNTPIAPKSSGQKLSVPNFLQSYFQNNPRILAWGKERGGVSLIYWNPRFLQDLHKDEKEISKIWDSTSQEEQSKLFVSNGGHLLLANLSIRFGFPLVLFSDRKKGGAEASFFLIAPGELWESARSALQTDLFRIWVVDAQGKLVAHTDESEALSGKDYSKNPLVQFLLRNPADNGSQTAEFEGKETLGSFQQLEDGNLAVVSSLEADRAFEAVYRIRRQNLYILLSVLSLAFLVVFFFSRTLTVPIINLLSATRQIERGNYRVAIKPVTRDEVGVLTNSFLAMAKGLEEREKIKDTFGKFVNKEIAERALAGDISLGGETKEVAVFFSDLRDFTGMAEKMRPSEVVEFLNQYFTEMVECIYLTQGIVDKFIGDAIMAHWGALYSDGNDTRNAVNAALLMRNALLEFNRIGLQMGRPKARFGCGINTGPVVAGQIGSEKKYEFTVIGDTVNLASRIEYMNKDFGTDILVSESSYLKVQETFYFEKLPAIWIRGKEEPQTLYAVLGWKSDKESPKNLEELRKICGIPTPTSPSKALAQ